MSIDRHLSSAFPTTGDIPSSLISDLPRHAPYYLVNGEVRQWEGEMHAVYSAVEQRDGDEYTPLLLGSCPHLDESAGIAALDAAINAYASGVGCWPTMSVAGRIKHLELFAVRLAEVRNVVTRLMTLEICKPLAQSVMEFDRTVEYVGDTVAALREMERNNGRSIVEQGIRGKVRRAPLGVVLCMGPYNFPLNEIFATLIPALAMGNTAVVVAPKLGRLLFTPLLDALRDCFPPGVVNVLFGDDTVVRPILQSGRVDVFAFIGASRSADVLRQLHPNPRRLRCVFGLDAKNPAIVLESADMALTAREVLHGSLGFSGQRCTALKIVFVHESRAEELVARLREGIAGLKIGMPYENGVDITPMPEPGKIAYLQGLVDDAVAHGASIMNDGGGRAEQSLYQPTLLYPVSKDMRVYNEEQFGPLVPVVPFSEAQEVVEYQMQSNFGQQVSIFGQDPDAVGQLIDPLANQVCRVNLNCKCQRGPDIFPFTGRKDSAERTLSVTDALRCFSIPSMVAVRETVGNIELLDAISQRGCCNFLCDDAESHEEM